MTRLAILDMYDGYPNQGMRCIQEIVRQFDHELEWKVFDVRGKAELPDMTYDIFISTGGPGSPHDGDGDWDRKYYQWLESVWLWNQYENRSRKFVFFICHSFQMAVKHFRLAQVTKRRTMSFGTFPVHLNTAGRQEPLFEALPNPFYVADFREWQVIQPDRARFRQMGARLLALEKKRPHVPLERAVMSIRFSPEMFGVQFHPEADPEGMLDHFLKPQKQKAVIAEHGDLRYRRMIEHLNDEDKIRLTHEVVLPAFLRRALEHVNQPAVMV